MIGLHHRSLRWQVSTPKWESRSASRAQRRLSLAVALLAVACGGGPPPQGPTDRDLVERSVDPAVTGPGVAGGIGTHFVVAPSSQGEKGVLVLFLPGTGGRPDHYGSFLRHAGQAGYHTIGLSYRNAEAVNDLCPSVATPGCHENVRIEVITGEERSALVDVDRANSIDGRVAALIGHLDRTNSSEGWGAFLAGTAPRWDRITVAGHSQGGGHAAMIARLRLVNRAVLFAATEPAAWTTAAFATPRERLYGFIHRRDDSFAGMTLSWRMMTLPGQLTSIDGSAPPFGGAHQLETNTSLCVGLASAATFHGCPVVEARTPLEAGRPLFGAVWSYLIGG